LLPGSAAAAHAGKGKQGDEHVEGEEAVPPVGQIVVPGFNSHRGHTLPGRSAIA
jgi:hypothetical protein